MKRYALVPLLLAVVLLVGAVPSAHSQTGQQPSITFLHQYSLDTYGFAVLNDTVTFSALNSTSTIPTVKIGIPDSIMNKSAGVHFVMSGAQYSATQSDVAGTTQFTISAKGASLSFGTSSSFSIQTFVRDVATETNGSSTSASFLIFASPATNFTASDKLLIGLPTTVSLETTPAGFTVGSNTTGQYYSETLAGPLTASVQTGTIEMGQSGVFQPIDVKDVVTTVTAAGSGAPQVSDLFDIENLGQTAISSLKVDLLSNNVKNVTILPSTNPPLLNPLPVKASDGLITFTSAPLTGPISPGQNFTFAISYPVPTSDLAVSGDTVKISLPDSPPINAVADSYTAQLSLPVGLSSTNSSSITIKNASTLNTTPVSFTYALGLAWAAYGGLPLASLLFVVVFLGLYVRNSGRTGTKQIGASGADEVEENAEGGAAQERSPASRVSDMISTFEEKIGLFNETIEDVSKKSPGQMGKAEFDVIRTRLNSARSRALQRLNEARMSIPSKAFSDLAAQVQRASSDETRASMDLLNLYEQYITRKMKEDTFRRLLPGYKKRVESSTNHLSDSLHETQRESGRS